MELIYLGEKLDTSKHHDLNSNSEFGFNVTVEYGSYFNNIVIEYRNVTQVDSLYDNEVDAGPGPDKEHKIAFESDIHQTGCNRLFERIDRVTIELATELHKEFHFERK